MSFFRFFVFFFLCSPSSLPFSSLLTSSTPDLFKMVQFFPILAFLSTMALETTLSAPTPMGTPPAAMTSARLAADS